MVSRRGNFGKNVFWRLDLGQADPLRYAHLNKRLFFRIRQAVQLFLFTLTKIFVAFGETLSSLDRDTDVTGL